MRKQRACLIAAIGASFVAAATPASAQQQFTYTAQLQATTRASGAVTASSIAWQCNGATCTTAGPWLQPGVGACHALALQVGRVTAYGRQGAMLTAAQLAQCNEGVPGPLIISPRIIQQPQLPAPQMRTPQAQPAPQNNTPAPVRGGPIRTETLTITGTGTLPAPPPPFAPLTVRTTQLTITGTGALPAPPPPTPPRTVRVPTPLTITGTGSLTPSP